MKFILFSVCLVSAALAKPSATRQRRDILPGDPRYGTSYHHNHEQRYYESQQQQQHQQQQYQPQQQYYQPQQQYHQPQQQYYQTQQQPYKPQQQQQQQYHHETQQTGAIVIPSAAYGVPNFTPSQPIQYQEPAIEQTYEQSFQQPQQIQSFQQHPQILTIQLPQRVQTVQQQPQQVQAFQPSQLYVPTSSGSDYQAPERVESANNAYLAPVIHQQEYQTSQVFAAQPAPVTQAPVIYQQPQVNRQPEHHAVSSNAYLTPVSSQSSNGYQAPTIQAAPQPVQHQAGTVRPVHVQTFARVQHRPAAAAAAAAAAVHKVIAQVKNLARPVHHHAHLQAQTSVQANGGFGSFGASSNGGLHYQGAAPFQQPQQEPTQATGSNGGYVY